MFLAMQSKFKNSTIFLDVTQRTVLLFIKSESTYFLELVAMQFFNVDSMFSYTPWTKRVVGFGVNEAKRICPRMISIQLFLKGVIFCIE